MHCLHLLFIDLHVRFRDTKNPFCQQCDVVPTFGRRSHKQTWFSIRHLKLQDFGYRSHAFHCKGFLGAEHGRDLGVAHPCGILHLRILHLCLSCGLSQDCDILTNDIGFAKKTTPSAVYSKSVSKSATGTTPPPLRCPWQETTPQKCEKEYILSILLPRSCVRLLFGMQDYKPKTMIIGHILPAVARSWAREVGGRHQSSQSMLTWHARLQTDILVLLLSCLFVRAAKRWRRAASGPLAGTHPKSRSLVILLFEAVY